MTGTATRSGWSLGAPPADYEIGHVRAVLADRILDDARVVVRDGLIADISRHPPGHTADVDGAGMYCLPGIVDVHSDGLEREILPRPGALLPWEFALLSFEGKLRAAGVTTVFHGAAFEDGTSPSTARSVATTRELCAAVAARETGTVEHRLLHRLDVRCAAGLAALREQLATPRGTALVSHEDHTPGQGQYADRGYFERYVAGTRGLSADEARTHVDELVTHRDGLLGVRDTALAWLAEQTRAGTIRLMAHDPASAEEVDALVRRGGSVAEFPTTLDAARAARERGLPVVAGAPNVLRGGSHAGNVSGAELAERGLLSALASDYLPSALLAAAFRLATSGTLTLPAAVGLVTAGPASAAGLPDRGALTRGLRADLVLAAVAGDWPEVRAVVRAETT